MSVLVLRMKAALLRILIIYTFLCGSSNSSGPVKIELGQFKKHLCQFIFFTDYYYYIFDLYT